MIEVIEESENEGNILNNPNNNLGLKINGNLPINNEPDFYEANINCNGNLNNLCIFNIPESCSLSQRELLLNANNPQYRNNNINGMRFKDYHTGTTLNTYGSLVGKKNIYILIN